MGHSDREVTEKLEFIILTDPMIVFSKLLKLV